MKLPPLSALPAFEATVRLGSMSAAAEELGRTHGAVSKQLAHLSEQAGVALFYKSGTGVAPTAEGLMLADAVRPALTRLEHAWHDVQRRAESPELDIAVSATFAMRWLMPRMPRFYQRHPDAQVNFRMNGKVRLTNSDFDLMLTWDRLRWEFGERKDIVRLGDVAFGIVHAPGLQTECRDKTFKVHNRCVQQLPGDVWGAYQRQTGITVEADSKTAYEHTFLVIEATLAGFGAALVERRLVEEELADGRLVAPFGFLKIENGFGAILADQGHRHRLADAFLEWLREEAATTPL
ncbi:LysR substrate-binding domain-containing protein [Roseibium sp. FZY0029]|uniref:LysR substrate-binding domain-containing protein n=1 Tax=Roseibium sp. FZY0029 TaxID=3116647 RepID=UPI002ECE204F|nr:LysR substrate-binding domain-containing protein [Roseibium sp. FZY0029]